MCNDSENKIALLNPIQKKAFALIQADARFLFTFVEIHKNVKQNSNYNMMALPYMGLFVDGAEKWGKKVGIDTSEFTDEEKQCYEAMRSSIKCFEMSFAGFSALLQAALTKSDNHFYSTRSLMSKMINLYYNVGTDVLVDKYCGNTILCSIYAPNFSFSKEYNTFLRDIFIVAGKLTAQYGGTQQAYRLNSQMMFEYKDFHFFDKCPLKSKNFSDFVIFSILCTINYLLLFIDKFFIDEFPAKLRFAYILYYYLLNFINDMNNTLSTNFYINEKFVNKLFRNCMAHYGLGQVMMETDINEADLMMFGLTEKLFSVSYLELKQYIYTELSCVADQMEKYLF